MIKLFYYSMILLAGLVVSHAAIIDSNMMAKRGLDEELFVNGGEKDFAKRSPYCNRATIGACIVGSDSYCNANYRDWGFYCKAGAAAACMSLMCYDEPPVSVAIQFVYASATTVIDFCRTGTTSPSQYWG